MEESRRSFLKKTAAAGSAAIAVPAIISASAFGSNATEGEQGHGKSHQKSMKSTSKPSFMIRHTVAFKLKYPIGSAEEKEFLAAGAKLSEIPEVLNFESLRETSPKNDFEYGFSMEFESMDAYEGYNQNAYHTKFVQTYWVNYVEKFLEIDYELL